MIVLDSNVISALMVPNAENGPAVAWLDSLREDEIWTTSVCLYEILAGIMHLPEGRRRRGLTEAYRALAADVLGGRILPFDVAAAEAAATILAARHRAGLNIGTRDTQIAGIAMARKATLATRNLRHFRDLDVRIVDPWNPARRGGA